MTKKEIKTLAQKVAEIELDETISNGRKENLIFDLIADLTADEIVAVGNRVDKIIGNKY